VAIGGWVERPFRAALATFVAALTLSAVGLSMPVTTAAAAGWSLVSSANLAGFADQGLNSVSCLSQNFCMAVGQYRSPDLGVHPLIERWDGSAWSIVSNTTGNDALRSVSCASTSSCVAVGDESLIERWDGSAWTVMTSPVIGTLQGVSCTAPGACTAVGYVAGATRYTLIESLSGGAWGLVSSPNVWGPNQTPLDNQLDGVSCVSTTACTAVGSNSNGTKKQPLIESSTHGDQWSIVSNPDVSTGDSALHGVSCVSVSACTAVGETATATTPSALIERWNGSQWLPVPTQPSLNNGDILESVSCTSSSACTAAGYSVTGGTLVEQGNGAVWQVQPTPNPSPLTGTEYDHLRGVSCVAKNQCTSVGDYYNGGNVHFGVVERQRGGSWSIAPSPHRQVFGDDLEGVSCVAATRCTAVGAFINNNGVTQSLIESWDGSSWTAIPSSGSGESSVSCVSAQSCMAVGSVLQEWNGSSWSVLPNPAGSAGSVRSVSCVATDMCMAVGNVIEKWNGSSWSVVPGAAPGALLQGVSCVSAQSCMAVGMLEDSNFVPVHTVAESWDGTTWTLRPTSDGQLHQNALMGVSCDGPTSCTAVGLTSSGQPQALVEVWDGAAWTLEPTSIDGTLLGVSCVSGGSCTAVGWNFNGTVTASGRAASWTIASTPTSATPKDVLLGVACLNTGACTAVGRSDSNGESTTLVEVSS